MVKLLRKFSTTETDNLGNLHDIMLNCVTRKAIVQHGEFTNSHYTFAFQNTFERLQRAEDELARGLLTMRDFKLSALINLPPRTYKPLPTLNIHPLIQISKANFYFLGQYYYMFDNMELERPILSWEVLC